LKTKIFAMNLRVRFLVKKVYVEFFFFVMSTFRLKKIQWFLVLPSRLWIIGFCVWQLVCIF